MIEQVNLALGYLNKTDETFFDDMTINSNLQLNNESKTNLYVSEKNVDNNKVAQYPHQDNLLDINTQCDSEVQKLKNNFNLICDLVTANKDFSMLNFLKKN